jgi:folate-binding protein YgfZ
MGWWDNAETELGGAVGRGPASLDVVTLSGGDALAFAHRMSTAPLEGLSTGAGALGCFPDKKGRLQGTAVVWRAADDRVELVMPAGAEEGALFAYLDAFLFTEDVELSTRRVTGRSVIGADPGALWGVPTPPLFGGVAVEGGALIRWFDVAPSGAVAWCWWVPDAGAEVPAALAAAAALDDGKLEALRVAAGVPGAAELTPAHNPLELALHDAIAWDKGCYPGQEVIARIDNYDKQSRHLVALEQTGGSPVAVGDELRGEDGKALGKVTSAAATPLPSSPVALALLRTKTPFDQALTTAGGAQLVSRMRLAAQEPHD